MIIDSPTIVLKENAQGRWNYSSLILAAGRSSTNVPPPALEIRDGRVGIEADNAGLFQVQNLELSIPNPERHSAWSFTLVGTLMHHGKLKIRGQAGPLDSYQGAPVLPVSALIDLEDFDLSEWTWAGAASHLGGSLTIDGSLESNGRTVDINGQATASKLKFSRAGQGTADPVEMVLNCGDVISASRRERLLCWAATTPPERRSIWT